MEKYYEIYLAKKYVQKEDLFNLINKIIKYTGIFTNFSLIITKELNKIRFYIKTKYNLPATINDLNSFLLEKTSDIVLPKEDITLPYLMINESNIIDIINNFEIKNKGDLQYIEIKLSKGIGKRIKRQVNIYTSYNNEIIKYRALLTSISSLLSIDFEGNKRYEYKAIPKYLDISKCLNVLSENKDNALLKINTFPYLNEDYYLNLYNYSFNKHSVILGASGSGKSKLISLLINNINQDNILKNNYRVIVIDPHASLQDDIGGFSKIIDFNNNDSSINLFGSFNNDIVAETEIYLDLFKSLISDQYNAKLERVLRFSTYLLLSLDSFNFTNLRKLLLDLDYRNNMINASKNNVPICVIEFFLSDFNELKTKSYSESISPIISFIDEMSMIPVFNSLEKYSSLYETICNNTVTLFSLDRTKLGDKITKTISGLVMQNILNIIQARKNNEHIILVVDEVAIVENPILCKFLSEARKYNLSLILSGQYFNQISDELKDAIFANVSNYYLFRVAKIDANVLVDNIDMKIPLDNNKDKKVKMLSELPNRSCIVRIEKDGKLLPTITGTTLDYISKPSLRSVSKEVTKYIDKNTNTNIVFNTGAKTSLKDILRKNSTSRKEI